jgi:uncharacterized protein (TIGR02145 family)
VPTDSEWTAFEEQLGNDSRKRLKSTSGWASWDTDLNCQNCAVASVEYKKICSVCKGTGKNGKETQSGNGTNNSGFSGLPGGYRLNDGSFGNIGGFGCWWSGTEFNSFRSYCRGLNSYGIGAFRYNEDKEKGLSVRCLRD